MRLPKSLVVLAVLVPSVVFAAPFCVVSSFGRDCVYFDARTCRETARGVGGMCVANSENEAVGDAPFCAIAGGIKQCFYYDVSACRAAGPCVPR